MSDIPVSLNEDVASLLKKRNEDPSAGANEALRAYFAVLDLAGGDIRGRFSVREAALLCDIFKSTDMDIERLKDWPDIFSWDVEDTEKYEKLAEKADLNADQLEEKLGAMTPFEALWLHDRIRMFWRQARNDEKDTEVLTKLFKCGEE